MAVLFIDLTELPKKNGGFTIIRAYTANPLDLYFSKNLIDILSRLNVLFDLCFLNETFLLCMKEIREDESKKSISFN